jgi:hypothetical protein
MPVSPIRSFLSSVASFSPCSLGKALLDRVACVSFRALGIGAVGLGIGAVALYYVSSQSLAKKESQHPSTPEGFTIYFKNKSKQPVPAYSALGRQAIDFALGLSTTDEYPVEASDIDRLEMLYYHRCNPWRTVLKSPEGKNSWGDQAFIETTNELMQIAYAISCLTLDDLPEFTKTLKTQGKLTTYADVLTKNHAFYRLPKLYHCARGGIYIENDVEERHPDNIAPHAEPFYAEGTVQSSWRSLYNEYCARRRIYVTDEELRYDPRKVDWTQPDSGRDFRTLSYFASC